MAPSKKTPARPPRKGAAKRASPAAKAAARRTAPRKAASRRAPAPRPAIGSGTSAKGQEVRLVVARSLVAQGRIQLAVEAPPRIRLPFGALLLVRHAYALQEASPDRESYTFTLHAGIEGHEKERLVERISDRMGVDDDLEGFIQHRFRPRAPGTYHLDFDVEAEYVVGPWGSRKVQQQDRRVGAGRVTVVVG
ncbi:MAG TPA: hypothetical protein VM286_09270 [Candidatus Thermoplasmatota archaeon]|nr:hypothetical protein [Candidatus Thermoplasmatota archaeon]